MPYWRYSICFVVHIECCHSACSIVFIALCVTCVWPCPVLCKCIASVHCVFLYELGVDVWPYLGIISLSYVWLASFDMLPSSYPYAAFLLSICCLPPVHMLPSSYPYALYLYW